MCNLKNGSIRNLLCPSEQKHLYHNIETRANNIIKWRQPMMWYIFIYYCNTEEPTAGAPKVKRFISSWPHRISKSSFGPKRASSFSRVFFLNGFYFLLECSWLTILYWFQMYSEVYTWACIYSFSNHFPMEVIIEYWVELPVLHSRSQPSILNTAVYARQSESPSLSLSSPPVAIRSLKTFLDLFKILTS